MQNGFFRKLPPFPDYVSTESVRQRLWKNLPLLIYCFIARCTVLNVSHAGYSKGRWSDPETLERSRSFVPRREFYYSRERLLTSVVSTTETPKHTPLQNLSLPCSSMREGMYFLVYVALSAVNTTSKL
ncbi:hypothetical protein AVEN_117675-1 [Araneus ventricosus]|uniref:Uncharacterized protein n=1 Tax=Araneus ventricosus TaxID=182803 RepID=A0A4Y2MIC7_ARAVE|nr:hypothetical protein AVEN_117675-1 [Araneus ventricosus]